MTHRTELGDEPQTAEEMLELMGMLRAFRLVRAHGGWGRVSMAIKGAKVYEIETSYTEKASKMLEMAAWEE